MSISFMLMTSRTYHELINYVWKDIKLSSMILFQRCGRPRITVFGKESALHIIQKRLPKLKTPRRFGNLASVMKVDEHLAVE